MKNEEIINKSNNMASNILMVDDIGEYDALSIACLKAARAIFQCGGKANYKRVLDKIIGELEND